MAYQTVFKRYELKYIITREQRDHILKAMAPYMTADQFGKSTIRNIYFDTDDHILARHSVAKPDFKEKLRIRSYSKADSDSTVFVELKRKADHLVYKRRIALPERAAVNWTTGIASSCPDTGTMPGAGGAGRSAVYDARTADRSAGSGSKAAGLQMAKEIDYFLSYYGSLHPAAFLSYDRTAYRMKPACGSADMAEACRDMDFRVTFDENILFRDYDISLRSEVYGTHLIAEDNVLMEIKCSGGIPLWMVQVLSGEHIYKTSFSKYGTAYVKCILPKLFRKCA